jgi:hypothetical protein
VSDFPFTLYTNKHAAGIVLGMFAHDVKVCTLPTIDQAVGCHSQDLLQCNRLHMDAHPEPGIRSYLAAGRRGHHPRQC